LTGTTPPTWIRIWRALHSQILFYRADGRTRFTVTLTIELAVGFGVRRAAFAAVGRAVQSLRLTCAPDILAWRIHPRDRDQKHTEMANAVVRSARFAVLFPDERLFRPIDTTSIAADAVAEHVVRLAAIRA